MFGPIKHAAKMTWQAAKLNSPAILTGVGIVSFVAAIPLTAAGVRKMEELKKETDISKLSKKQKAKMAGKCYWKTMAAAGLGTACVLAGYSKRAEKLSAVGAAFMASQQELAANKETIKEVLGAKKAKQVEDAINERKVTESVRNGAPYTILKADGVDFYEVWSGCRIRTTYEALEGAFDKFAANALHEYCINGDMMCVNDLRRMIGFDDPVETGMGKMMFWCYDDCQQSDFKDFHPVYLAPVEIDGIKYIPYEYSIEPMFYDYYHE